MRSGRSHIVTAFCSARISFAHLTKINLGIAPELIPTAVHQLCEDTRTQLTHRTYGLDEIIARADSGLRTTRYDHRSTHYLTNSPSLFHRIRVSHASVSDESGA